jgi:hypothetical protein
LFARADRLAAVHIGEKMKMYKGSQWWKRNLAISCTLVWLVGCVIDPVPFPGPQMSTPPADAGHYSPSDAAGSQDVVSFDGGTPDTGVDVADSFTALFELLNDSSESVYIQTGTHSGPPSWYAVSTADGALLPIHDDCAVPNCDDPDGGVCGIALSMAQELKPGDSHQAQWDGRMWEHLSDGDPGAMGCEQAFTSPATSYNVTLCWGIATVQDDPGEQVTDITCESVAFEAEQTAPTIFTITDPNPDTSDGS